MAFIKTPDLWDQDTIAAINSGALVLQPAQWVRCGADNPHAALWVGRNPESGTLYVAHWQGSKAATLARYHTLKGAVVGRLSAF